MPPPRLKGIGHTTGAVPARPSSNTPMSERQQMALLIQMTASSSTDTLRTQSKKIENKKGDTENDEIITNDKQNVCDAKIKSPIEHSKADLSELNIEQNAVTFTTKRTFSDIEEEFEECADESKKKKRKDSDSSRETKNSAPKPSARFDKSFKQTTLKGSPSINKTNNTLEKDPADVHKSVEIENEAEEAEEYKSNDSLYNGGLKVPPLKIVIPQQNCSIDTEGNVLRTGKIAASRNVALPYVVSSNSDTIDNTLTNQCSSPHESPHKINVCSNVLDDKNIKLFNDEKNLRVLRSSHRGGITSAERSSNNSSPQMQSSSPSPLSNHANDTVDSKVSYTNMTSSPLQQSQLFDQETITNVPSPSTSSTSSCKDNNASLNVDLHPRKRKIRPKNIIDDNFKNSNISINLNTDGSANSGESHPHDYPFTNGFQMFLNIRRQIEKKWKNLYQIKPRPPQGYNEYLLTKKSYLIGKTTNIPDICIPNVIPGGMQDFYLEQEKARQELIGRHTVERQKLCLNVEQEIIRVHSKAARSISGQSAPFSVCTYLKDDEVYNLITPEQDEKEKSARCRFNGRLLLSWLQDVDDKWEKIKESLILRHHNEAESLHAVQLMDWNIFLRQMDLFDYIFETHLHKDNVPIVHVGDDFEILPS